MNEHFTDQELNQIEQQIRNNNDKNDIVIVTDGTIDIPEISEKYSTNVEDIKFIVGDIFGICEVGGVFDTSEEIEIKSAQIILRVVDDTIVATDLINNLYVSSRARQQARRLKNSTDRFYLNDPFNIREKKDK